MRQNPLGFIGSGPAAQLKVEGCFLHPTAICPQGLGDLLAHAQCKTRWDVVVKQQPPAPAPGRQAVILLSSCGNSSRDTSQNGHI